MRIGAEVLVSDERERIRGKRIGLVTNMTGVNERLVSTIDMLHEDDAFDLRALFAPEHGIRGDEDAGKPIDTFTDERTGLPVYSLYGQSKKPTPEMLQAIDIMLLDLQDVGSRYYTYMYTMAHVMEACGEQGVPMLVLDRPNPIGGKQVEGNFINTKAVSSFVGQFPIPNRHGLTLGELALLFHREYGLQCDIEVVQMDGWKRDMYFDETGRIWVPPSPNATGLSMCLLYPGTCLVEGLNVSEGRGTAFPFEVIGAPFLDAYELAKQVNARDLPGVIARPVSFTPTYQKHQGHRCFGVQLHVTNRHVFQPLRTGLVVLERMVQMAPDDVQFLQNRNGRYFLDALTRTEDVRRHLVAGTVDTFLNSIREEALSFQALSSKYQLYP